MCVFNRYGVAIDFDVALGYMDEDIIKNILCDEYGMSDQYLFTAYEDEYLRLFGKEWDLSRESPIF